MHHGVRVDGFTPGEDLRNLMETATSLPPSPSRRWNWIWWHHSTSPGTGLRWNRVALSRSGSICVLPRPNGVSCGCSRPGELDVDAQGIPTGEIAVKAENWRDMIAMANAAGALPDQAVDPVTRALNFLAGLGGNPNALDSATELPRRVSWRLGLCPWALPRA